MRPWLGAKIVNLGMWVAGMGRQERLYVVSAMFRLVLMKEGWYERDHKHG